MPLRNVTVALGNQSHIPGAFTIKFSDTSETLHADPAYLREQFAEAKDREALFFAQIVLRLDAQGVNPRTATLAQLKTAIEGVIYRLPG